MVVVWVGRLRNLGCRPSDGNSGWDDAKAGGDMRPAHRGSQGVSLSGLSGSLQRAASTVTCRRDGPGGFRADADGGELIGYGSL